MKVATGVQIFWLPRKAMDQQLFHLANPNQILQNQTASELANRYLGNDESNQVANPNQIAPGLVLLWSTDLTIRPKDAYASNAARQQQIQPL